MRNFIPVRYGTVFLQNPGIPVLFGTVLALYFHPRIFWKFLEIFLFSLLVPLVINLETFQKCLAGHLRRHMRMHSGEKSNKCNQCDFASSRAGNLRTHLKTHSGVKSDKCNQCDFASSRADNLRRHLKTHREKSIHPV